MGELVTIIRGFRCVPIMTIYAREMFPGLCHKTLQLLSVALLVILFFKSFAFLFLTLTSFPLFFSVYYTYIYMRSRESAHESKYLIHQESKLENLNLWRRFTLEMVKIFLFEYFSTMGGEKKDVT